MKLLIYAHDWAPTIGGIQTVTQSLARGLAADTSPRIDVTLATMTPANGMDDAALPYRVVRRPGAAALLRLVMKSDVVHVAGPCLLPLAFSLMLRKPVVVEHHGFQAVCPNGQLLHQPDCVPCPGYFMVGRHLECIRCNAVDGRRLSARMWLLTFVRRAFCTRVACNIVPTDWLGAEVCLPRTKTIPHGLLSPVPAPPTAVCPTTFLFVGRLVSTKGIQILLQAVRRLRDTVASFRVNLVGDGPERAALEETARGLGITDHVFFSGSLSDRAFRDAWAASTVLVVPSVGGEVFGLVVAEAMLHSRPAIVPAGGALAEVAGPAGLTFPAGDVAGLADCMRRFLDQPELAELLGRIARERAHRIFAEDIMVKQHAFLYVEIASAPQAL